MHYISFSSTLFHFGALYRDIEHYFSLSSIMSWFESFMTFSCLVLFSSSPTKFLAQYFAGIKHSYTYHSHCLYLAFGLHAVDCFVAQCHIVLWRITLRHMSLYVAQRSSCYLHALPLKEVSSSESQTDCMGEASSPFRHSFYCLRCDSSRHCQRIRLPLHYVSKNHIGQLFAVWREKLVHIFLTPCL